MCVFVPLSPGFTVCMCMSEKERANGWKSFILARVCRVAVNRSADVARFFPSIPANEVISSHKSLQSV